MPDDRLVQVSLRRSLIVDSFREGHIHPALLRDLEEFMRHAGRYSLTEVVPELAGKPASFDVFYERVDPHLLPLRTFSFSRGRDDGRPWYGIHVRSDMMSVALARELNEVAIPENLGAIQLPDGQRLPDIPKPRRTLQTYEKAAVFHSLDGYGVRRLESV
jgi:hypothetical protein